MRLTVHLLPALLVTCLAGTGYAQSNQPLTTGRIIYDDSQLEKLIPRTTRLEIIASGLQHIESPLWLRDSSCLLFSDTRAGIIYRWSAAKGLSKFLEHTGFTGRPPYSEEPGSNGLAITANGTLLICEHGDRRIAAYPLNGHYGRRTVTDNYNGKRYNSPNDVIVKSDGSAYFTDPPYGLPMKEKDTLRETGISGVYRMGADGKVDLLISDLPYPNGIALSPDEKELYISVSDENHPQILRYPVKGDGTLGKGKLFFDAACLPRMQGKQVTDGLKVDRTGNLWASGPGGLLVISPGGRLLGRIETYEVISNCAWDDKGTTLYLTAGSYLYRLQVGR